MFRGCIHSVTLVLALVACGDRYSTTEGEGHGGGSPSGGDDEGVEFCPDPENSRVHYRDHDPARCAEEGLECTEDQNGFDNACGCGCIDKGDPLCPPIDDTTITWLSRDPAACSEVAPACPLGSIGFTNSCGCGCIGK